MISRIFHNFFSLLCKKYIRLYLYQSVNSSVSSTTLGCTFWVSSGCVYNPLRGFLVVVQVSILLQGVWLGHRFKKKLRWEKAKLIFMWKWRFLILFFLLFVWQQWQMWCAMGIFLLLTKIMNAFFCVNLIEPKVQTSNWYLTIFFIENINFFLVTWN